jgi:hypothetical protein
MNVHGEEGFNSVLRIRVIFFEVDPNLHQSQNPNPHNFNEEQI